MKKTLLFISALVAGVTGFAQTIPNWGFESWTNSTTPMNWSNQINYATSGTFTTSGSAPTVDSAAGKIGSSAIAVHSKLVLTKVLPGVSVSGSNASVDLAVVLGAGFSVVSSNQSLYGSFPATTVPKTLSGFARFRTMPDSVLKGGITIQLYKAGAVVGGYVNPNAVGTADSVSFVIDTVTATQGFMNFNIPITCSQASIDSIRIILSTAIPSVATRATSADTLWVDGLRFLSCTPDPVISVATTTLSSDASAGITTTLNTSASASYNHVFTTVVIDPTIAVQQGQTVTITPIDSVIWTTITPPSGLTYTPGEPSGLQYANSAYCFSIMGNLPATAPASYSMAIQQTTYGMLNTAFGSTTLPQGSLTVPGFGTIPVDVRNTPVDTIKISVAGATPTPTVTATGNVLTSSASSGNQWYKNGNPIGGATATTYTATANGVYTTSVSGAALSNAVTISSFLSCTPDAAVNSSVQGIRSDDGSSGVSHDGVLTLPSSSAGAAYNHTFTIFIQNPTITTVNTQFGPQTVTLSPVDSIRWTPISLPSGLTYTGGSATNIAFGGAAYCFTITGNLPSAAGTYKWLIQQTPYGILNTAFGSTTVPVGSLTVPGVGAIPVDLTNTTVDSIMVTIGTGGGMGIGSLDASTFSVAQNTPNPFSASTSIAFSTPSAGTVTFTVTDVLGRTVSSQTINASAGVNTINYSAGANDSGTYFYTLSNGSSTITKKFVIAK